MELKKFVNDVEMLIKEAKKYLEQHEDELVQFMRSRDRSPEESLEKELILEWLDHVRGLCHTVEYAAKQIIKTGYVCQREDGEILFDGVCLPLMTELEILIYDEILGHEVWTRTYVGGLQRKYLVGMKERMQDGVSVMARIRE